MASPFSSLLQLISSNVQRLESQYSKNGAPLPSLDEPFKPGPIDFDPVALDASQQIIAAATQLIAITRLPEMTIREVSPGMYLSACLGYVVDSDIPEILDEAGPKGLHSKEIDKKTGRPQSAQTGRILRYLAMRHIFREVSPDVFANNRVSSVLVKEGNRSVAELQANPQHKYDDTGLASFIGHVTDEGLKSSAYIAGFLEKPQEGSASPFNLAFGTKASMWEWFEEPGNDVRSRRFNAAMTHGGRMFRDEVTINAFDWNSLGPKDVIVDVGGNVGSVTQILARHFSKPQYVIQDLAKVIPGSKQFWQTTFPDAVSEGRVKFQVHNFFEPQPVSGAAVYFMRFVLHDWADSECIKILQSLRKAAAPHSKLILFEFLVPYACEDTVNPTFAGARSLPAPLLPNTDTGTFQTMMDIQMLNITGGQERTLGGFIELGKASGWKFENVKHGIPGAFIFSPA